MHRAERLSGRRTTIAPFRQEKSWLGGSGVGDRLTEFAMFGLRTFDPVTIVVMGFGIVIIAALTLVF